MDMGTYALLHLSVNYIVPSRNLTCDMWSASYIRE